MEFEFAESLESIDVVPQDFRGLYTEVEGKYKLDSEHPGVKSAVSAVTSLNKALKAERAGVKALKSKASVDLSPLADFGATPEEIKEKVTARMAELEAAATGNDKEAKMNLEKIKQNLAAAHANDLMKHAKKNEALEGQLHKLLVTNAAQAAIVDAKGDMELLMPFVKQQVKVQAEDGELKVHVVDAAGDIRFSGVTGQPMSINELVREMKDNKKYGKLFASETQNGGGGTDNSSQRRVATGKEEKDMTPTEKIAAGLRARQGRR